MIPSWKFIMKLSMTPALIVSGVVLGIGFQTFASDAPSNVLVRDNTFPVLGEAYRDPSGLIWGDAIMMHSKDIQKDGQEGFLYLEAGEAALYCKSLGAHLPTKDEVSNLLKYNVSGLPHRNYQPSHDIYSRAYKFWTSSTIYNGIPLSFNLDGTYNFEGSPFPRQALAFRCVATKSDIMTDYAKVDPAQRCQERQLEKDSVGTTCINSKGVTFQRYVDTKTEELGVRDLGENGQIWFDKSSVAKDMPAAATQCENAEGRTLPTDVDFEVAEAHGFREAIHLGNVGNGLWFLSTGRKQVANFNYYATNQKVDLSVPVAGINPPLFYVSKCVKK